MSIRICTTGKVLIKEHFYMIFYIPHYKAFQLSEDVQVFFRSELLHFQYTLLSPKIDTPLFATSATSLQLYHSPRMKILLFKLRY